MKNAWKVCLITAKFLEVLHWIAAFVMACLFFCCICAKDWSLRFLQTLVSWSGAEFSTYGFEVTVTDSAGMISLTTAALFFVGAVIILSLMAMVFRNISLIIKKTERNGTPFQKDNIRMLGEIGIFNIAVPITALFMMVIIRLAVGVDNVETSVSLYGFVTGILIFTLTNIFSYGMTLQNDVDGLL